MDYLPSKKIIFLGLIPIVVVAIYLLLFGVNVPFLDQWDVVMLMIKKQQGLMVLSDLFALHNENRPFFPRLIWLTLAQITHYNVNAEMWLNFVITLGTFAFFVNRTVRMWKRLNVSVTPFMIPLMSLLVFNLGQRDSWLQGFQTLVYLGTSCAVIGLFLLADDSGWKTFFAAVFLGVVANYSNVNGLLYWFVGLPVLWVTLSGKLRIIRSLIWAVVGAIAISFFFVGWHPIAVTDYSYPFLHPLEWIFWIVDFLGAPLMTVWQVAWFFGTISVALYIPLVLRTVKSGQWKALVPYFGVVLFLLLTGLSISFGRMTMGMVQAAASRYLTMSVWYWACLLALLPLLPLRKILLQGFYLLITVTLVFHTLGGGWRGYVSLYQRMLPAYQAIHAHQPMDDAMLTRIYPDTEAVRPWIQFICDQKLSVCADLP